MEQAPYFYDGEGKRIGSADELLPLSEGMVVTIHGHQSPFQVGSLTYHHGHSDEDNGLHAHLIKLASESVFDKPGVESFHDQQAAVDLVKETARKEAIKRLNG